MSSQDSKTSIGHKLSFRNWRISNKLLVVMLLVSLVPLLLAMGIVVRTNSEALTDAKRQAIALLGNSVALRYSNLLLDSRNLLQITASNPAIAAFLEAPPAAASTTPPAPVQEAFATLLNTNPQINVVGLYNPGATTMAHTDPALVGKNVAFRDFVGAALTGESFVSGLRRDLVSDAPGVSFSVPVIEDGAIIGAMAMNIKGDFFTSVFSETLDAASKQEIGAAIAMFLVDPNGIVMGQSKGDDLIYRSLGTLSPAAAERVAERKPLGGVCPTDQPECTPAEKLARQPEAVPGLQPLGDQVSSAFAANQAGSLRFCRPDDLTTAPPADNCVGAWHIGAYAPVLLVLPDASGAEVPVQQFMVVVDIPEQSFLAAVDQQRGLGLVVAGVMGVLAVVGSLFLARLIAKPINRLAASAHEVEQDQPFQPQGVANVTAQGDEIGHLARVFSKMVLSLQARMVDLRTIYDVGRSISTSIDLDETLSYVASAVRGVIPYDAAEITLLDASQEHMTPYLAVGGEPLGAELPVYSKDMGLIGRMTGKGEAVLVPDLNTAPESITEPHRTWSNLQPRSYLGVPLQVQGKTIGAIELVSRKPHGFSEENLRLLASIAMQAAIAIQNAREVRVREESYKQQIQELHIEIDEMKRAQQVGEIVESEYFQRLSSQAQRLRSSRTKSGE